MSETPSEFPLLRFRERHLTDPLRRAGFSSVAAAGGEQGARLGGVPAVGVLPVADVRRAAAADGTAGAVLRHLLPHDGLQLGRHVRPAAAVAAAQQHRGRGEDGKAGASQNGRESSDSWCPRGHSYGTE